MARRLEAAGNLMDRYSYVGSELELFARAVRWKRYVRDQLAPYLGRRVVEVGAGQGSTTEILCRGGQELWLCLEPDPTLASRIEEARLASRLPACCRVRAGTSADLRIEDQLDTAVYIDVLEHIADDRAELRRSASALVRGGHLAVMSPAHPSLYSAFDAAIGHHRRYTRETLTAAAPPGLRLVRFAFLDSIGLIVSLANRLLLRRRMPTRRQIATWDRAMIPFSRRVDPILGWRVGKSVLAVWQVP